VSEGSISKGMMTLSIVFTKIFIAQSITVKLIDSRRYFLDRREGDMKKIVCLFISAKVKGQKVKKTSKIHFSKNALEEVF
jgi:hypothetical protein